MRKLMLTALLLPMLVYAADTVPTIPTSDIQGAADLPYLKRYEGSLLVEQVQKSFDEIGLPVDALDISKPSQGLGATYAPKQTMTLEGKVTRMVYLIPPDRSPLEVIRNYQEELSPKGGEVLFECKGKDCGGRDEDGATKLSDPATTNMLDFLFPLPLAQEKEGSVNHCILIDDHTDMRYAAMKMTTPDINEVHLGLLAFVLKGEETYISEKNEYGRCTPLTGRTGLIVVAVEHKPREQKMVTVVPADDMGKGIGEQGHVALYGIYFDYDKADIKPDSKPQLEEIAKMLKADAALNVLVVGHTDNQGELAYNLDLSKRRAESVVKALSADYGIDVKRLTAQGVGMAAPVASNDTEDGKAKNRRVEIVKR